MKGTTNTSPDRDAPARPTRSGINFRGRVLIDAALIGVACGAVLVLRKSGVVGEGSGGDATIAVLAAALVTLLFRLANRMTLDVRRLWRRTRCDAAAASVSFMLSFPLFLMAVSLLVQLALMCQARIVVNHAAYTAVRSAITSSADGLKDAQQRTRRAAAMALSGLSPRGRSGGEGQKAQRYLSRIGAEIEAGFPRRFNYALDPAATKITQSPTSLYQRGPTDVTVQLEYRFLLTVPYAASVLGARQENVAGVSGKFIRLRASCTLRSPPGRGMIGQLQGLW